MFRHEISIGMPVWASVSDYGWRPAFVAKIGREQSAKTIIHLLFDSGARSGGKRLSGDLEPRNPALRGKDKPKPLWKQKDEMDEDQQEENEVSSRVFDNCNVCGIALRTLDEDRMGMCERCAAE
jgi:hypothetical protein